MGKEQWKVIPEHEPYEASTYGRIRRPLIDGYYILKPYIRDNGYAAVTISNGGVHRARLVHRLVALTFIDNPENKQYVNHLDNDKTNNAVSNLEWCTAKENTAWSIKQGRNKSFGNSQRKIRATCIKDGKQFEFITTRGAQDLGFSSGWVSRCCNGLVDSYKGYRFEYLE